MHVYRHALRGGRLRVHPAGCVHGISRLCRFCWRGCAQRLLLLHLSRHVASQGGGSDDESLAALEGGQHTVELLVLEIECLHTHTCSGYQSRLTGHLQSLGLAA